MYMYAYTFTNIYYVCIYIHYIYIYIAYISVCLEPHRIHRSGRRPRAGRWWHRPFSVRRGFHLPPSEWTPRGSIRARGSLGFALLRGVASPEVDVCSFVSVEAIHQVTFV